MPLANSWSFNFQNAVTPNAGANTTLAITNAGQTIADFTTAKPADCIGFSGVVAVNPNTESIIINDDEVFDGDLFNVGFVNEVEGIENPDALNDLLSQLLGSNFAASATGATTATLTGQWYVPLDKL